MARKARYLTSLLLLLIGPPLWLLFQQDPPQAQYEEFPFLERDAALDYTGMQRMGAKLG